MKLASVFAALILAFITGSLLQLAEINSYKEKAKASADSICDIVTLRAQSGSTRDVYDQAFLFLRKFSPDPKASLLIKNGGKEYGSESTDRQTFQIKCAIANTPDYEIISVFSKKVFFSYDLARLVSILFLAFVALSKLADLIYYKIKKLWSEQIIYQLRFELGLTNAPQSSGFLSQWIAIQMSQPLVSLKKSILELRDDLLKSQQANLTSKLTIQTQMKEKNQAQAFEEKVHMVRHDLKGPLSAMKIAVSANGEKELLPGIIKSIEKIINNLEQKDESEQIEGIEAVKTEIAEVCVQNAVDEKLLALRNQSQIKIIYDYSFSSLSPVKVNSDYLHRVIANLIQNAIEAIGDHPGKIAIMSENKDSIIQIVIRDDGSGIEKAQLPFIFDRGHTFGKQNGTGLGLYFAKTCINAWGGNIYVESEIGMGTIFTIHLPIQKMPVEFQGPQALRDISKLSFLDDEIDVLKSHWANERQQEQLYFNSPSIFMKWYDKSDKDHALIIDMNLNNTISGLDIIRTIGKKPHVYLTTSEYLNKEALDLASEYDFSIIPKPLLASSTNLFLG